MPTRSNITYAEDEFGVSTLTDWLDALDARQINVAGPPVSRPLGEAPDAAPVYARMNYARWLGDCDCASAVLLFRGVAGKWFWCPACGNASTSGKLRPVMWPKDRDRIDTDRATVPAALANWEPGSDSATNEPPPNRGV